MRHHLTNKTSAIVTIAFVTFSLLTLLIACNNGSQSGNGDTTTTRTEQGDTSALLGIREFPYLKITKATLYAAFYERPSAPPFKKLMLSFKINDYAHVPASLTLLAHGAKNDNDPTEALPVELQTETGNSPLSTSGLLYSTLELSDRQIRNLVEISPGEWKEFDYLVFIPYIEIRDGRNYLSYHVQLRPILPGGAADQENTNPCPPFRPE